MEKNNSDLRIILIEITQKCNMLCDQCGSRCNSHSGELLSKKDIIDALKDVKTNIGTDMMINISGGEPLMRTDLFDIMNEVSSMGFDWGMVSNGVLINDDVIERMKASQMKTITISIDGLEKTHDSLRHYNGAWKKIIENLKKLKAANFLDHLQVTFTANKRNVYEFKDLYDILNGIGLDSIRVSFIDPIGRAQDNLDLLLDTTEMEWLMNFANRVNNRESIKSGNTPIEWGCPHYLGKKLNRRTFECFTGINMASILYNGDIFVCPNVPRLPELVQGNIKEDSFSYIWKTGFEQFRNRKMFQSEQCRGCRHWKECKGDSIHTWDFENKKPKFCYSNFFEGNAANKRMESIKQYREDIETGIGFETGDTESNMTLIIEKEAWKDIKTFFHFGKKHPVSMHEQQLGLFGFRLSKYGYVLRYVYKSRIKRLDRDLAMFELDTMKEMQGELEILKRNIPESDDKDKLLIGSIKFLGFMHSHPIQEELQYSIGDEAIHRVLARKYKNYMGILVNPVKEAIGGYYGREIKELKLIVSEG